MSGPTVKQLLEFLDLPNEIISHIFIFCDSVAPSLLTSHSRPVRPSINPDAATPLKKASVLSHRLRKLTLPLLFCHIYVSLDHLNALLAYTTTQGLDQHVASAQVYLASPSTHRQPLWWHALLSHYPRLHNLTITAPPSVFAEIVAQPIKVTDQWAFKIPYQTLLLSYSPTSSPSPSPPSNSILTTRPWTTLLINESSSLPAYTTYEYFLRHTPTPLTPSPSPPARHLYAHLTHFNYTAIFPTYNHVAEILDLAKTYMTNLASLTIKLLPDPESTVLEETLQHHGFHFDVNDPWNEFETSQTLVAAAVVAMSQEREREEGGEGRRVEGKLRSLSVEDVRMEGVRDRIEDTITGVLAEHPRLGWGYEGEGVWRRGVVGIGGDGDGDETKESRTV